ncbi:MAG: glycerol-3-phosphate 1-O-acyltransferase PlsY [Rhodospirillales bacterium]
MPPSLGAQWPFFAGAVLAYLLGSVPFGLVLTRAAGIGDIRKVGSGNIGATNVLRTGRKGLAALTLLLDGGKGAAAALLGFRFGGPDMAAIAAFFAVIGHVFPVWLRFKGGKGVATALGALLGLAWTAGLAACLTWVVVAALFRYSSLAALAALGLAPVYAWHLGSPQQGQMMALVFVLSLWTHRENIRRLLKGQESRIGRKP